MGLTEIKFDIETFPRYFWAILSPGITNKPPKSIVPADIISRLCLWGGASFLLITMAVLLDAPVAQALSVHSNPFLASFAHFVSRLGEGWVVAVAGLLCAAGLSLAGRANAARIVFLVAAVGLLTGATATLLRSVIGRTRPNAHVVQGVYGIRYDSHWIIGRSEFGSFPSGHAATVVGLAAAAWMLNRRFGIATGAYAALVSWSRIAQGVHHFSDIVAASILGIVGAPILLARAGPWLKVMEQTFHEAWFGERQGAAASNGSDASGLAGFTAGFRGIYATRVAPLRRIFRTLSKPGRAPGSRELPARSYRNPDRESGDHARSGSTSVACP
jgi:membrane-associated phospholipid phosphatase